MSTTTEFFLFYTESFSSATIRIDLNDTIDTSDPSTKAKFLLYDYLIPTIGFFIIVMNLAVVISSGLILKKGQEPRSTYLFLGNVAMTDLITGIAVILGQVYPISRRNHEICSIQLGMIVSSTLASIFSVGLIAIDRFLYIIHGMQYEQWVYPNRARLLICLTWLLGCLVGFMPLFGWHGDTKNGKICWFILLAPKELVALTVSIGFVPILIVMTLYSVVLYNAIKTINRFQQSNPSQAEPDPSSGNIRMFRGGAKKSTSQLEIEEQSIEDPKGISRFFKKKQRAQAPRPPQKWRAIKVVFFTTGSFVFTWSPYFVTSLVYVYSCEFNDTSQKCKRMRLLIASPLAILGFMNSLLNPIIYAWWHKGFRGFVKKKINSMLMRKTNVVGVANSSGTTGSTVQSDQRNNVVVIEEMVPNNDGNTVVISETLDKN